MFRTLIADVGYALRVFWRTPSFALAVIAVLAIGIGANIGIFSIVSAVLLRPLPFKQPEQMVRLFHEPPQSAFPGIHRFSVSPANFYDWQRDSRSFESMAIYRFRQFALTNDGNAESIVAGAVGDEFFSAIGTPPHLGRVFLPEEDAPARKHGEFLAGRIPLAEPSHRWPRRHLAGRLVPTERIRAPWHQPTYERDPYWGINWRSA